MKALLISACLSFWVALSFGQQAEAVSGKMENVPLPAPPQEVLKLNGALVYTLEVQQASPFEQWALLTPATSERMEGVFNMYLIPAFAPLDPNFNMDEFVMKARTSGKGLTPVVSDGIAHVRYNLQNGPIQKGDYITISSEAGVGMKATESGFTVGVALENSDATEKPGLIKVRVMVRYERF